MAKERVNTLWFEGRLGYMERLSIVSALAQGHEVFVYSYKPETLGALPAGAELRHASEVMDDPERVRLFDGRFKALGSNFFRYELFAKRLGYWIDLDVIMLQPLQFDTDYVFGWEHETSINGAILKLPADCPMLEDLRAIPYKNWRPPYFGPKRTLQYYWMRLRKGDVQLDDLPWGVAGPAMITHTAKKHKKAALAQPVEVFYPVPYGKAQDLFEDAAVVESMLTPDTKAIHMWNSALRDWRDRSPPEGSFMAKMCEKFSVSVR